jgi:hypothetical protein
MAPKPLRHKSAELKLTANAAGGMASSEQANSPRTQLNLLELLVDTS